MCIDTCLQEHDLTTLILWSSRRTCLSLPRRLLSIAAALALSGVGVLFCVCGFSEVELSRSAISLWLKPCLGLITFPACVASSWKKQPPPIETNRGLFGAGSSLCAYADLMLIFRIKYERRVAAATTAQRLASKLTALGLRCLVLILVLRHPHCVPCRLLGQCKTGAIVHTRRPNQQCCCHK